jgi:hypothetical protein
LSSEIKKSFEKMVEFDRAMTRFPFEGDRLLFQDPPLGFWSERFSIYASGFELRSRIAMEDIYRILSKLLGEEKWRLLGGAFFDEYPSRSFSLNHIGDNLPRFMIQAAWEKSWIDLAQLELFIWKSFHAFEKQNEITESDISSIESESCFLFQKSAHLFKSEFQVVKAWQTKTKIETGREFSLIYRKNFEVFAVVLSEEEFGILKRLEEGYSLGDAVDALEAEIEPQIFSRWLKEWLGIGLFYGIERV